MSCAEYMETLTELALGAQADARARAHLAGCPACRGELERLRTLAVAMDKDLAEIANAEPARGFAARVRARLVDRSAVSAFSWQGWVPTLAGGLAVVVLLVWLAGNPTGSPLVTDDFPTVVVPKEVPSPPVAPPPTERTKTHFAAKPKVAPEGHRDAPQLPEVLLADDPWAQVVKLYALARQRRAQAEQLRPPDASPLEEKFQPLAIARLEIKPLAEAPPGSQ